jgi:hypothetical protein
MNFEGSCHNERGAALVIGLMFLAILAMAGATAVVLTTTDIQIGGNYKASAKAFHNADAGVNYGLAKMKAALKANPDTFLPNDVGNPTDPDDPNSVSLAAFVAPSGFSFSYKDPGLTKTAENPDIFIFTTVGADPNDTSATGTITATLKRKPAIQFGAFGDKTLDLGNTAAVYSYSHSDNPSPTPEDSTGQGDVGSNGSVILRNKSIVDGDVGLGESTSGTDATLDNKSGLDITPEYVDRVDPDPLGVVGGEYEQKFTAYSTCPSNHNCCCDTCPVTAHCPSILVYDPHSAISVNDIDLGNSETLTLKGKSGGANYYFHDITLGNGSTLYIDTTNGPVNIYLTGEIDAITGSNFVNTTDTSCASGNCTCVAGSCTRGAPSDFAIFANSQDSTDKISIGNSVTFSGLIYAPYITVRMDNSADIYGAIVGGEVEIVNGVQVFYDTDMADAYKTTDLILTSWREVRD